MVTPTKSTREVSFLLANDFSVKGTNTTLFRIVTKTMCVILVRVWDTKLCNGTAYPATTTIFRHTYKKIATKQKDYGTRLIDVMRPKIILRVVVIKFRGKNYEST